MPVLFNTVKDLDALTSSQQKSQSYPTTQAGIEKTLSILYGTESTAGLGKNNEESEALKPISAHKTAQPPVVTRVQAYSTAHLPAVLSEKLS